MKTENKKWVVDRLTRKGTGMNYFWIIQDGEGEDANEILRIPSRYPAPDGSEELANTIIRDHNEHFALEMAFRALKSLIDAAHWSPLANWNIGPMDSSKGGKMEFARQALAAVLEARDAVADRFHGIRHGGGNRLA